MQVSYSIAAQWSNISHLLLFHSQQHQKYTVLLILTDGLINDMESTIASLVAASGHPLSVLIVGVGAENFSGMWIFHYYFKWIFHYSLFCSIIFRHECVGWWWCSLTLWSNSSFPWHCAICPVSSFNHSLVFMLLFISWIIWLSYFLDSVNTLRRALKHLPRIYWKRWEYIFIDESIRISCILFHSHC